MAKVSPVSIKYMVHANFTAEGALEKPDVIGALFGQTEGLLGADLEMRELQKEGKIGRIEVELERNGRKTIGVIKIPTALDQSETTLIAAAIETIERIGPSDAQIEIDKIEDVRGSKRDYILERAKKLMQDVKGSTDSREISNEIKDSSRVANIGKYGKEELPCGDLSGKEVVVVEGRADVVNLLKAGANNVIAMNGTKLPDAIKELGRTKELTLFVDGDRGGKLIIQNATDNANIAYIAIAPDGKEVEELTGKEILMILRKKISVKDFFRRGGPRETPRPADRADLDEVTEKISLDENDKVKLKGIADQISGSGKAILLDSNLHDYKTTSARGLSGLLKKIEKRPVIIVMDGSVTNSIITAAEDARCQVIVAKNFSATSPNIQLLSL
jgi:DNA primase